MNEATNTADLVSIAVDPITQLVLSVSLAFTMLTVALSLRPADFEFVRSHPTSMLVGFTAQIVALPLVTLLLIKGLFLPAGMALGMIIVACCPGGAMSNLITKIAGGDSAYSVSLTMLSSVFSALMLPLAILFWVSLHGPANALIDDINIDRAAFVQNTMVILVIPLALGLLVSWKRPALAVVLHTRFMPVSLLILVGLIVSGLITNFDVVASHGMQILPLVVLHNGVAFLTGGIIGRLFLADTRKARALVFEVGIQNAGLGLIIVMTQLGGLGEAAILVGSWSIWHLVGGFSLAALYRKFRPLQMRAIP